MPAPHPSAWLCAALLLNFLAFDLPAWANDPEPVPAAIIESQGIDLFGASSAGDVDTLFVGAPVTDNLSGAVHLFYRGPAGFSEWRKHAVLHPTWHAPVRLFGETLAFDQDTVAVSALHGPVFIFERAPFSNDYTQVAALEVPEDTDFQPGSMSVSEGVLAVGVNLDNAGSVRIYQRTATGWELRGDVQADDAGPGAQFGTSVALLGNFLVVGAPGVNSAAGAVYVFQRVGGVFVQRQKLTSPDPQAGAWFGGSVATNGGLIIVGQPGNGNESDTTGHAYVFDWIAPFDTPNFTFTQELIPTEPPLARDRFGLAVGIDGNNRDIVVTRFRTAPTLGTQHPGSACVFTLGVNGWTERLHLAPTAGEFPDAFGASLSVGSVHAVIGDYGTDEKPGAVYIYDLTLPELAPVFTDAPSDTQINAPPGQSAEVTFVASVADENGDDLDVHWEVDGTEVQSDFVDGSHPFTRGTVTCTTILTPGLHHIRLLAVQRVGDVQTEHTFTATVGDFAGPTIHSIVALPSELQASHGRLLSVRIVVDATDAGGPVRWRITGVKSSDPTGRRLDWIIPPNGHGLLVRAETTDPGRNRVYTIEITASDASGNRTKDETTVTVLAGHKQKR